MFTHKGTYGQHRIFSYDVSTHPFLEFFTQLYETQELNKLHLRSEEFQRPGLQDVETSLHKQFYAKIKSDDTFKRLYCAFVQSIHAQFFPEEKYLIYQSFPSVRFQFINNTAVPPHCDSDSLGQHPIGEKNFLIPITEMVRSKRLFIESEPEKGDYAGIDLQYGDLFFFNGNKCIHYNTENVEDTIRISLDFRVLTIADYLNYIKAGSITYTNPRDPEKTRTPTRMTIGGYYQVTSKTATLEEMLQWHFQRELLLQSQPNFDEKEAIACYEYMKTGKNFVTEFQQTTALEKMICTYTGAKHCIMTTSGNMAIILALMACGIGAGDVVVVPNYTMIASINSIKFVGAIPKIVDVDPVSLTVSLPALDAVFRDTAVKAVLHVSLNNRHADISAIATFCKTRGVILIEDAAQSLGCFVDGVHFGRFGSVGCFSLSTPKIISTGQGGFLLTDDDSIARNIGMMKNFGRISGGIDVFEVFGLNAKFTDIQAVIGIEQMKKLPERVVRMRQIFYIYYSMLSDYMIPPQSDSWIPWFVDIFVDRRDELMTFLKAHNIQTRATYPEINKTPMYADEITHSVSHMVSTRGLFLPSHSLLRNEEILYICKLIKLFYS